MHNVTTEIKGSKLILTMDIGAATLSSAPMSSSGKTKLAASTGGPLPIALPTGGTGSLSVALNLMFKP